MPIGLTCTGNPRTFVTLLSSNAPTKLAPILRLHSFCSTDYSYMVEGGLTSMFNASFHNDNDMNALVSEIIVHIVGLAINGPVILYYFYRPIVKSVLW